MAHVCGFGLVPESPCQIRSLEELLGCCITGRPGRSVRYTLDGIYSRRYSRGYGPYSSRTNSRGKFLALEKEVQNEILALTRLLQQFGPKLGRPRADTLKDSRRANMKELRFDAADGVWRAAFAFDPKHRGILLVAGDKSGGRQKRFYRELIRKADQRFDEHLNRIKKEGK